MDFSPFGINSKENVDFLLAELNQEMFDFLHIELNQRNVGILFFRNKIQGNGNPS